MAISFPSGICQSAQRRKSADAISEPPQDTTAGAEVSMLLGHSELRVTMDFYAHLQQQTAAKAAKRMDAILG
jgi:hypothetical protein